MRIVLWLHVITLFVSLAFSQDSATQIQSKIVPLFEQARQAEQRRDFAVALKLYDRILQLDSNLAEVWTNKGLVLYELNRHGEALAAFRRSSELKPQLLIPLVFQGIEYLKLDEPQKAVKPLQSALSIEPHHSQASYELANAYARLEQFDQAIKLYGDLLQSQPQLEQAWYRLGITYLNWSKSTVRQLLNSPTPSPYGKILLAELLAVTNQLADAESNLQAALVALPHSVEAHLALSRFCLESKTSPDGFRIAEEQLAKAKEIDPGDLQVELIWLRLDLLQEKLSSALTRLETALLTDLPFVRKHLAELTVGIPPDRLRKIIAGINALDSDQDRPTKKSLGAAGLLYSAFIGLHQPGPAEEYLRSFERLVEAVRVGSEPTKLVSYTRRHEQLLREQKLRTLSITEETELAVIRWNLGEYEQCLQSLTDVIKRATHEPALYWLSRVCRILAQQTFEATIARNPNSYRAHLLLADLANDSHDTAKALAEYEKAISLGPSDPEVHVLFIQFLMSKEWDNQALERAQSAVAQFPTHPGLNNELGKLLLKAGNLQQAVLHFQQALAADPGLASSRAGLADSYAALGKFEKAIQEMKQALDSDSDGSFHYRLARWYQKTGLTHEVNEAFATSSQLKEKKREQERVKLALVEPQ